MRTDLLPRDGLILCAVSGGADSTYLLLRLLELGYTVAAAHYHHGIRGETADRDEMFVSRLCGRLGVPFVSEHGDAVSYAGEHGIGLEDAARRLRYAFLERAADRMDAAVIATAHTADDNTETILMHLTRGSGLRGLGGIPPARGRIVRPMLDTTREEVEAYLAARGETYMEDETNALDDAMRNRIRHTVIPALREENPALSETFGRMAEHLREDEAFLSGLADSFISENAEENTLPTEALLALPRPVALRVIRRMAGDGLSARHAEEILSLAAHDGYADVTGMRVGASKGRIAFGVRRPALPDRPVTPGGTTELPESGLLVQCSVLDKYPEEVHRPLNTFYFKCENICGNMTVGARRDGDTYRPDGRGCAKRLKQLFSENRIPVWNRDRIPVLRDDGGILGVYGFAPAQRAAARPGDRGVLEVRFIPLAGIWEDN